MLSQLGMLILTLPTNEERDEIASTIYICYYCWSGLKFRQTFNFCDTFPIIYFFNRSYRFYAYTKTKEKKMLWSA